MAEECSRLPEEEVLGQIPGLMDGVLKESARPCACGRAIIDFMGFIRYVQEKRDLHKDMAPEKKQQLQILTNLVRRCPISDAKANALWDNVWAGDDGEPEKNVKRVTEALEDALRKCD